MEPAMTAISAEELNSWINQHFGFLVDEYGFQPNKNSDSNYDFVSFTTKISLFTEYNRLVVSILPIGEEGRKLLRNNIPSEAPDVILVVEALQPDLGYKIIWDAPISSTMQRKSEVVKSYCTDFFARGLHKPDRRVRLS
jgi:hypothetical protein